MLYFDLTRVDIADNLKNGIDNNLLTCGVFLDFAKAFDTVNHVILLKKMEMYGIRGLPLHWFTNYLTNRQQYVSLTGTESRKQTMVCGVPQGSSLGPLLFLIYINEVDRKWGFWDIDLGNFRKLGQFSFLNLNFAEKSKNKRKKYKN